MGGLINNSSESLLGDPTSPGGNTNSCQINIGGSSVIHCCVVLCVFFFTIVKGRRVETLRQ